MTTPSGKYAELGYTLPPSIAEKQPRNKNLNKPYVYADDGGVTVVLPDVPGSYARALEIALASAKQYLGELVGPGKPIPAPWRVLVVDSEAMGEHYLANLDGTHKPGPTTTPGVPA